MVPKGCFEQLLKTIVPKCCFEQLLKTMVPKCCFENLLKTMVPKGCFANLLNTMVPKGCFENLLETMVPTDGMLCVDNCYDRWDNHKLFKNAVGYKCDLHLRIGTLAMLDESQERGACAKHYAICQALCPRKLHLASTYTMDVHPKKMKLAGVITEPKDTFPVKALPPTVVAFLDVPTIVVTLSVSGLGASLEYNLADQHALKPTLFHLLLWSTL